MKIAVSAQGKGPDSPLDPRFGRAPGFVLFDTDSGTFGYLDNSGQVDLAQGAGIQTAQTIADAGVALLITGRVGPKAEVALEQAGIKVVLSGRDTVEQALADYREGGPAASPAAAPAGGRGMGGGGGQGMGGGGGRGMGGGGGGCRRAGGTGRGMGGGGGRGMGGGGGGGGGGRGGRGTGG